MAAVESYPITIHPSSSSASPLLSASKSTIATTTPPRKNINDNNNDHKNIIYQLPPLRLVSRWNVRRGGSTNENHYLNGGLIPLPPPIIINTTNISTTSSSTTTTKNNNTNINNNNPLSNPILAGRIMHIFVDPTGCHTILSAYNGEAYYIHSLVNSNVVRKLKGFGPNVDGSMNYNSMNSGSGGAGSSSSSSSGNHGFVSGCALSEVSTTTTTTSSTTGSGSDDMMYNNVQMGITPGSYITSVGWDKKRGTEGSTKKILIGTSYGEIYEYYLNASLSSDGGTTSMSSSNSHNKGSGSGGNSGNGDEEISAILSDDPLPILLVRLNASEKSYGRIDDSNNINSSNYNRSGGAVTGLHFERLSVGDSSSSNFSGRSNVDNHGGTNDDQVDIIVLAVTSGLNKHTRFHTYLSTPSSGDDRIGGITSSTTSTTTTTSSDRSFFHRVFAHDEPTSRRSFIELPGSINYADLKICEERFAMRTETGIYYGSIDKSTSMVVPISKSSSGIIDAGMLPYTSSVPVSIALTPYHFILLSDSGEVQFINRVSKKIIQKDRLDWVFTGQGGGVFDDGLHGGGNNELIMDVRKPNQVWLWKSRTLIHISSSREDRDVWKFSLEACLTSVPKMSSSFRIRGSHYNDEKYLDIEFDNAKALCTNNVQKAIVTAARAKYHLAHNRIELAAKYMAQCPSELMPFAETCLQLSLPMLGIGDTIGKNNSYKGLISYLLHKMQYYKARNDNVACTMLGAWLVELYLHERERNGYFDIDLEEKKSSQARTNIGNNNVLLQQFLSSNAYNMDAKTILRILCSHDATATECEVYAASSGDIGTAVNAALCIAEVKVSDIKFPNIYSAIISLLNFFLSAIFHRMVLLMHFGF